MTVLEEARAILKGQTAMLATIEHLRALDDFYQSEIIKIAYEYDALTKQILQRN